MGALLYLHFASLQGRIRSRLLRLKQPKYLIGAIVGVAYIYYFFIHRARSGYAGPGYGGHGPGAPAYAPNLPTDVLPIVAAIGSLVILLLLVLSWVLPRGSATLAFSEAEIAFLFPAPIARRTLIHYRLLKSQLALAFSSVILTLFSNRWAFLGGSAATHALGWWVILVTLNLHFTGSSFAITRLLNRGVTSGKRRLIVFALVGLAIAVTFVWLRSSARLPAPGELLNPGAIRDYFLGVLQSGPLPWLLAIPKLIIAPFLAPDARAFALALGPALLVLGAHYAWVLHTEVSFEEASVARAEKRAARALAMRQGKFRDNATAGKSRRAPFRLAPTGRPETAFLWKNLLSTPPVFRPRSVLILAVIIVTGCTWLGSSPTYRGLLPAVAPIALLVAAFALLLGPQLARCDLRTDLPNADLLMTYPLRGWQIVFGELLAPVAILTAIVWLALLAAALSGTGHLPAWLDSEARTGIAVAAAVFVPPFFAIQLLVANSIAVLFPAWVQVVSNRGEHGLDVLGQRIVFVAGRLVAMALALVPPAIGAALVFAMTQWIVGPVGAATLGGLAGLAILCAEAWGGMQWLGGRFERFDLSSELRP